MRFDLEKFINQEAKELSKELKLEDSNQDFISCLINERFEELKKSIPELFTLYSLLEKSIEKNNFELFKELVDKRSLNLIHMELIIEFKRQQMFEYSLEFESKKVVDTFNLNWFELLKKSIKYDNLPIQQFIMDNYVHTPEQHSQVKEMLEEMVIDSNICLRSVLASPAFKRHIDINDIRVEMMSLFSNVCYHHEKDNFEFLTSDKLINPVSIHKNDDEALCWTVLGLKNQLEKMPTSFVLHYFLYEKKIQIKPTFFDNFKNNKELANEFKKYVEKRDAYFQLNEDLKPEKPGKKRKL